MREATGARERRASTFDLHRKNALLRRFEARRVRATAALGAVPVSILQGFATRRIRGWLANGSLAVACGCGPAERYEDRRFAAIETVDITPAEDGRAQGEAGLGDWSSTDSHDVHVHTLTTMSCLSRAGERCEANCSRSGDVCECLSLEGSGSGRIRRRAGWAVSEGLRATALSVRQRVARAPRRHRVCRGRFLTSAVCARFLAERRGF